jgi:glutathione S-transferase
MDLPILHHYWGSPYAEKIRLLLGYKKIDWLSCEIPVTPPRPNLAQVLGPFRRTPVLQLGADFICDTRLIAEAIDEFVPQPSLRTPANQALSQMICYWGEPRVFALFGPVRFRTAEDIAGAFNGAVSADQFGADRLPFMHPVYEAHRFGKIRASSLDHLRSYMDTLEVFFAGGDDFIGGVTPTFGDFSAYHTVWWLRMPPDHSEFLADYPAIKRWADRMAAFGHGTHRAIDDDDARQMMSRGGTAFQPDWTPRADRRLGQIVEIVPDDYGKNPVEGKVVAMTDRHVTIERATADMQTVRVHFPRMGYEIVTIGN